MEEGVKIEKVEHFLAGFEEIEISDISKIIKEMISIKKSKESHSTKKKRSYDINDKIKLNNISKNIGLKITRYHINSYDTVDEALTCLSIADPSIKIDLYDYYWDIYIDILIEFDIEEEDFESIKEKANLIYTDILKKIDTEIFFGKKSDIESNKRKTYIAAITSYVFYKCKFLIPINLVVN